MHLQSLYETKIARDKLGAKVAGIAPLVVADGEATAR
jgi:hypothetical protein